MKKDQHKLPQLIQLSEEIEEKLGNEFEEISHYLFTHPELGLEEFLSSKYLVNYLKDMGFEVEFPYATFETAFRAECGNKGPKIAFLAEYDALPGYGEEKKNGHACGHNWIAAATVGAAIVLSKLTDYRDFRVVVLGTPAEETYGSKVAMVEQGVFEDIDLVLQPHLAEGTCICYKALALDSFIFEFRGKASHASTAPWDGINALDAVHLLYAGVSAFRQHVKPDVRIHGIITEGGDVPNTVPEKAKAFYYVRSADRKYLNQVSERVLDIARGAALMTGAHLEIQRPELPMDNLINLPVLQELAEKHLLRNQITPEVSEAQAAEIAGSTDIGNVSHVCPTMYIEVGLNSPQPVFVHEESALELVDSPYAYERLHQTIKTMVAMSLEFVDDTVIQERSQKELKEVLHKD